MAGIEKVLFCALLVFYLIDIGYGLTCLSCQSTNGTSKCRKGGRSKSPKIKTCYGRNAKCYEKVTINEYGDATFERGCSKLGVCKRKEDVNLIEVSCATCQYNNCNYNYMDLDQKVVDYMLGLDYYDDEENIEEEYIISPPTTKSVIFRIADDDILTNEPENLGGKNEYEGEHDKGTDNAITFETTEYVIFNTEDEAIFKGKNQTENQEGLNENGGKYHNGTDNATSLELEEETELL